MLVELVTLVLEVLAKLTGIYAVVNTILAIVGVLPSDTSVQALITTTQTTLDDVTGIQSSIVAMEINLTDISTALAAQAVDLGNIYAAIPALGTPVVLPSPPPSGYGGDSATVVAANVWGSTIGPNGETASSLVGYAASLAYQELADYSSALNAVYFLPINRNFPMITSYTVNYPTFTPVDIRPSENLLTCLRRQNPLATITWYEGENGHAQVYMPVTAQQNQWVSTMDEAQFEALRLLANPVIFNRSAPLWPGLGGVNLLTTVALSEATYVPGVMDGVLVTITAMPPGKPTYTFGLMTATAHVGQITFVSDNAYAEYPQNLSFKDQIYVPMSMTQADGVILRCVPGVVGAVTPWQRIA